MNGKKLLNDTYEIGYMANLLTKDKDKTLNINLSTTKNYIIKK